MNARDRFPANIYPVGPRLASLATISPRENDSANLFPVGKRLLMLGQKLNERFVGRKNAERNKHPLLPLYTEKC